VGAAAGTTVVGATRTGACVGVAITAGATVGAAVGGGAVVGAAVVGGAAGVGDGCGALHAAPRRSGIGSAATRISRARRVSCMSLLAPKRGPFRNETGLVVGAQVRVVRGLAELGDDGARVARVNPLVQHHQDHRAAWREQQRADIARLIEVAGFVEDGHLRR
jgi:hypothetical protein